MTTDEIMDAYRARMLSEIPDNGTWHRRLRRWNIENDFFVTKMLLYLCGFGVLWIALEIVLWAFK